MKNETMIKNIHLLMGGQPIKLAKGDNRFSLISERQESQLFNLLHREFNAKSMTIRKIEDKRLSIVVCDQDDATFIKSEIHTR